MTPATTLFLKDHGSEAARARTSTAVGRRLRFRTPRPRFSHCLDMKAIGSPIQQRDASWVANESGLPFHNSETMRNETIRWQLRPTSARAHATANRKLKQTRPHQDSSESHRRCESDARS